MDTKKWVALAILIAAVVAVVTWVASSDRPKASKLVGR